MAAVEELRKDLEELEKFNNEATRQKVKNILSVEIRKLETEIKNKTEASLLEAKSITVASDSKRRLHREKITKYGWDESDKFMKLYITFDNVQSLDKDNVKSEFTDKSIYLSVDGLNNKNYEVQINNLCEEIDASKSYHKIKSDMVLVMLKKKNEGKTWFHVTASEKKKAESAKPKPDDKDMEDPQAGMMSLLKKMYEEGDDEMKRTIAKSMSESQNKSGMMM
ncbi:calcyclin-binding protein [Patella vulgata]|uniref:calcyclin-binding protein n=1 Tax=Patella vulgata TaxID=6465 RepID=UPI00217F82D3|nr:calcyclin-binding protein [Patella vulgata]